jgi:DNA repair exonuclease SbcCD nuclease subunit
LKIGIFSDTHVGCAVPKAIGDARREAFRKAFSTSINIFIQEKVAYVMHAGDLFERRTMLPEDSVFVKQELQRLVNGLNGKVKILIVRGNHDGTVENSALDYVKHPLAEYFIVLGERSLVGEPELFEDEKIAVQGLGYTAYPVARWNEVKLKVQEQFAKSKAKYKFLLFHAFVERQLGLPLQVPKHQVLTFDQFAGLQVNYILCGHQHRTTPMVTIDGISVLTPGATEAVELSDESVHGVYILTLNDKNVKVDFKPIVPLHKLKNIRCGGVGEKHDEEWYVNNGLALAKKEVESNLNEKLILRLLLEGTVEGDKYHVEEKISSALASMRKDWPNIIYLEVKNDLNMPVISVELNLGELKSEVYSKVFETFSDRKKTEAVELAEEVESMLEEHASSVTGLLTDFHRRRVADKWKKILEET